MWQPNGERLALHPSPTFSTLLTPPMSVDRCEPLGQTVGYQIRLESKRSHATRLLFCTTGVLLRRLHADRDLKGVSHVIVDEVHERSLQSDFLLIILRDVLRRRPALRIVLMSATINASLFANYFGTVPSPERPLLDVTDRESAEAQIAYDMGTLACEATPASPALTPAPTLHIPGFTHPVTEMWLEDILEMTGHMIEPGSTYAKRERSAEAGGGAAGLGFSEMVARNANMRHGDGSGKAKGAMRAEMEAAVAAAGDTSERAHSDHVYESIQVMDEERVNIDAIAALVHHIDETRGEGAILVFMPGARAITSLREPPASHLTPRLFVAKHGRYGRDLISARGSLGGQPTHAYASSAAPPLVHRVVRSARSLPTTAARAAQGGDCDQHCRDFDHHRRHSLCHRLGTRQGEPLRRAQPLTSAS